MPTGHRMSAAQLSATRWLYEEAHWLSVDEVAAIAGVNRATVHRHARIGAWRRRGPHGLVRQPLVHRAPALDALAGRLEARAPVPSNEAGDSLTPDRAALVAGLWRAVRLHVAELSGEAGTGGPEGGEAGAGRSAQTLMTIARTVEKLMELERADAAADLDAAGVGGPRTGGPRTGGPGAGGPGAGGAAWPAAAHGVGWEEFREEIARRLERFVEDGPD